MTEYDYSPEAYERYLETQARIARWVDDAEHCRSNFASPFVPSPRSDLDEEEAKAVSSSERSFHDDRDTYRHASPHRRHHLRESSSSGSSSTYPKPSTKPISPAPIRIAPSTGPPPVAPVYAHYPPPHPPYPTWRGPPPIPVPQLSPHLARIQPVPRPHSPGVVVLDGNPSRYVVYVDGSYPVMYARR